MTRRFGVTIDCLHPVTLAPFWCDLLGYVEEPPPDGYQSWPDYDLANGVPPAEAEKGATIVDPAGIQPRIYFQQVPEPKTGKNRLHIDVVASRQHTWDQVLAAAERAVSQGGSILRESDNADDRFIVLTDPEGNEFCVVL
jgi:hypothetical protein